MEIPRPTLKHFEIEPCYLYFFFGTVDRKWRRNEWMFVKVGVAVNVQRRLKSYQTHCPVPFHTGLRAAVPSVERARSLETSILNDRDLVGYRGQGEWFVILAGPHQHEIFIKELLASFYVERYRDRTLWNSRLEWVILPDQQRISEIPEADGHYFCDIERGEKAMLAPDWDGTEQSRRVKAEEQAKALARLIYPELVEEV